MNINENRKNGLISIMIIIFFLLGISFFFGFYFGEVKPREDKVDRTFKVTCKIDKVYNVSRDCHRKTCSVCGCNVGTSCIERVSNKENGNCCERSCCKTKECVGCSKTRTTCIEKKCSTTTYYDFCCYKECVEYAENKCYVEWGTCWTVYIDYHDIGGKNRTYAVGCGFNDLGCLYGTLNEFQVGSEKDCWLDTKHDSIEWKAPKGPGDWWVGVGFGIAFLGICFFLCIALTYRFCHNRNKQIVEKVKSPNIRKALSLETRKEERRSYSPNLPSPINRTEYISKPTINSSDIEDPPEYNDTFHTDNHEGE